MRVQVRGGLSGTIYDLESISRDDALQVVASCLPGGLRHEVLQIKELPEFIVSRLEEAGYIFMKATEDPPEA